MLDEKPIKIMYAAQYVGVSQKTVYNWLHLGYMRLYHPGYVLLSEVRRAQIRANNTKSDKSRQASKVSNRDRLGRFSSFD